MEQPVSWCAETGDIGITSPDQKYIGKIQLRLTVPEGSVVRVETSYDGGEHWRERYRYNASKLRSVAAPIIPRRCDSMRLRFSGVGPCEVYMVTYETEGGSER